MLPDAEVPAIGIFCPPLRGSERKRLISPTKTSFVAILGFEGLLPGSDCHPFDGLASASNIQFVRRLRYS
jgi:hypothetical protein